MTNADERTMKEGAGPAVLMYAERSRHTGCILTTSTSTALENAIGTETGTGMAIADEIVP